MTQLIHYTRCPVCDSADLRQALSAKDYTVSGETFAIVECTACTMRFTQDIPDENTIQPYYQSSEYISHTNTSRGLINGLYQWVRRRTIRTKRRLIKHLTGMQRGKLLDLGSGTGAFASSMQRAGWNVTGLEPDSKARELAKTVHGIDLADIDQFYALPEESFDAITLWHVLEHVHELNRYMLQLKKVLKTNGRLIIAVPNYTSKDAKIYKEYWAAYDVPRHLYHFSPQAMETLIKKSGLQLVQVRAMWYDSFYISLLSSKYKNGRANLLASAWNGLRSNFHAMWNVGRCSSVIYVVSN